MSFGFAIGDFITVGQLTWTLYQSCYKVAKDAPTEFQALKGELANLHGSLKILQEEVENPESVLVKAGEDRVRMVNEMVAGIGETLKKLEKGARKWGLLSDNSKGKNLWVRFKWSAEFPRIQSLRNKLVYHNGMMNLLLTSVGNSSLGRIESSHKALEAEIGDIKRYIRESSSQHQDSSASTAPLISIVDDELLSATLMKNAEILQPWNTIGADQWIKAGKWWLLKSQIELYGAQNIVPPSAYTKLIKASWILVDIIASHPQRSFFGSSMNHEVQILSAEIKREFRRINDNGLAVPDLHHLMDQDLLIWETQVTGPVLQPGNKPRGSELTHTYVELWTVSDEKILFQRFALYDRKGVVNTIPCMVMLLVHLAKMTARVIAQDQFGTALMEISVDHCSSMELLECTLRFEGGDITFTNLDDAKYLISIIDGAREYLNLGRKHLDLESLHGYIILAAIKSEYQEAVLQLLENHSPASGSLENDHIDSVLTVASRLGLDFIENQNHENSKKNFDPAISMDDLPLFIWAIELELVEVVRILLSAELYNVVAMTHDHERKALCLAAEQGNETIVDLLLISGYEIEDDDGQGGTALCQSASRGHEAVVQLLIERGANLEARDQSSRTALHLASDSGYEAIVESLLEKGANVQAKDSLDLTALHLAIQSGNDAVVRTLIVHGADVHAFCVIMGTPLHMAAFSGRESIVKVFLENGVNVDAGTPYTRSSPLHIATQYGNEKIVQMLIEKGANIDAEDCSGDTPLDTAYQENDEAMLRFTFRNGAHRGSKNLRDQKLSYTKRVGWRPTKILPYF